MERRHIVLPRRLRREAVNDARLENQPEGAPSRCSGP
ncbi:hypothetical protein [Paraburkholderia guartelaensis]